MIYGECMTKLGGRENMMTAKIEGRVIEHNGLWYLPRAQIGKAEEHEIIGQFRGNNGVAKRSTMSAMLT